PPDGRRHPGLFPDQVFDLALDFLSRSVAVFFNSSDITPSLFDITAALAITPAVKRLFAAENGLVDSVRPSSLLPGARHRRQDRSSCFRRGREGCLAIGAA